MNELMTGAVVPSAQTDKDKILGAIKEIDASLTRIEAERDLITEIAAEMKHEFSMGKKLINSIAKAYHEGNRSDIDLAFSEFTNFMDQVVK
jgi:hypothetical protein